MSPHDTLPVRVQWEKNGWESRGYYVIRNEYNNYICTYTPTDGGKYLLGVSDSTAGGRQEYNDQTYTHGQIREMIRRACQRDQGGAEAHDLGVSWNECI